MTTLWDFYCKVMAVSQVIPENLKPFVLGQAILECGRGTTQLAAAAFNFHALKYRSDINVRFPIGKFQYNGGDGLYDYCDFRSFGEELLGYWAFIHRVYYPAIDKHLTDGRDFLNYLGPIFCPPGYKIDWINRHGGHNYTQLICDDLLTEAIASLKQFGWKETPVIIPAPIPDPVPAQIPSGNLSIVNGMLLGSNVHRRLIAGHDHFKRFQTIGIMLHGTGCHAGTSRIIVDGLHSPGVLDAWDDPSQGKSAHILNTRDENIWQAVDLNLPAWGCYGWNNKVIHIENENFGPCDPWKEILGYFYRYAGTAWWQRMAKADMRLIAGKFCEDYLVGQVVNTVREIAAIRAAYPGPIWVKGHSEMPPPIAAWDPGSWWPWANIQR